jgi:hypothetical protein
MATRRKSQRRAGEMGELLADGAGDGERFGRGGGICSANRITENGGSGKKIARTAKPGRLARWEDSICRAVQ